MSDLNLYEIAQGALRIEEALEQDEIDEEGAKKLIEELKVLVKNEANSIIEMNAKYNDKIEAIKARKKRLNETQRAYKKKKANLKKFLKMAMDSLEMKKVDADIGRIQVRNTPGKVKIIDEASIPDKAIVTSKRISKKILKQMIKDGEVDKKFARIERGQSLTIK